MKISAKTLIIGISTLVVAGGSVAYYLTTQDSPETLGWMNSSWLYRRGITVENEGDDLLYEDVLIEVDTASLVSANKLQSDCDDLRFTNGDETTGISYWVEGGCNTSTTQIWVQIPEIRTGELTIYMYYGNTEAINAEESWSGQFTLLANATCPTGWTRNSDFDSKFVYGNTTYGNTGGTSSHDHGTYTGSTNGYTGIFQTLSGTTTVSSYNHEHSGVSISTGTSTVLPPYLDMVYCYKTKLDISSGLISIFESTPSGWTRFSALDSKFPRGASTYGGTGGAATHNHTTGSDTTTGPTATANAGGTGCIAGSSSHTHSISTATTSTNDSLPPYKDVVFASADSATTGIEDIITITNALPPLGWTRFSDLDNVFIRGASTYGGTGGTTTHTHTYSQSTSLGSGGLNVACSGTGPYVGNANSHSFSFTTNAVSNLPPYLSVLYYQRNSSITTTVGSEELNNSAPTEPTSLLAEGATNPARVVDTTPEFSAIYNDPDDYDEAIYYQIQVNTLSNFTGTVMWDSEKTSMIPTSEGNDIVISYAGTTLTLNGTTYYWRIKFWDDDDAEGPWSSVANFTMNTAPTAPTSLLTEGTTNPNGIEDTTPEFSAIFNDPNTGDTGVQYQIEVNTASDFSGTSMWDSTLTSMTSTAVGARSPDISYAGTTLALNGTTYYWRIKFADSGGLTSPWSSAGSFVMDGAPFAPTALLTDGMTNPTRILSTTPSFSAIYTDPNGDDADIYQIQVNTNNTFTGTVMWDSGQQATSTPDGQRSEEITYAGTPLTNQNVTYYWRIKFWDLENYEGPWSATAQFSSLQASFLFEGLLLEGIKVD